VVRAVAVSLILGFIALPLVVVAWTSVQPDTYPQLPPTGVSLRWWHTALTDEWLVPIWISFRVALLAAVISTLLGAAAAYGLSRSRRWLRWAIEAFIASPLLLPEIVVGLAVLQLVSQLHARQLLGTPLLVASHVVIGTPYVLRTVGVSLLGVDPSWERAAADLGASRAQVFRRVTLPLIRSGIFAGMLFSFVMSFNNVELSLFLTTSQTLTAPIAILQFMQFEYSPALACVAILTVGTVMVMVGIAARFTRVTHFIYGGKS
jgi:putative spermidine/putrescine transport system permease protein